MKTQFIRNYYLAFAALTCIVMAYPAFAADDSAATATTDIISQVQVLKSEQKNPLQPESKPQIEEKESVLEPPIAEGGSLLVKSIRFEGNNAISTQELNEAVADLINQTVSFKQLKETIQKITALYRSRGFLLARAFLPPQKIKDGEVMIGILEGRIGEVRVDDNRWFNDHIYQNYFRNMNNSKTFEYSDLESALYFLNEKEDRQAKAYLEPGKESGTTDITLKAKETFPLHASYEFSNRGSKFTNRARHTIHLRDTNLLGFDDTLVGGLSFAEQAAFRASWLQYSLPIQSTGTELGLNWTLAKTRLTKDLRPFDIEGRYFELTPSITQTLIRRRTFYLGWYGGFEIKDAKSTTANVKTYYDRMRVIRTGPRVTWQDRYGKTILSPDIHIGLGHFMGSLEKDDPNASRSGTGGSFAYYTGSVARLQRMPLASYLVLQANAQWSPVRLTSLEQFRAGGSSSVRGYPEGDSSGDRGYTASAELNFPIPLIPQKWEIPYVHKSFGESFRLIGFYDLGQTSNRSRILPTDEKNRFLMGAGFGTRISLKEYLHLQMDVGYPIGNDSTDKDRPQIHLSAKAGF